MSSMTVDEALQVLADEVERLKREGRKNASRFNSGRI